MTLARRIALAVCLLLLAARPQAFQGPPPEIRALVDGVIAAANGDAAAWEAFAQKSFTPAYLKQQTPAERSAFHQQIVDRFGTVSRGGVMRDSPDAPLQINVKGSKASGVIAVSVDDNTFRITNVSLGA